MRHRYIRFFISSTFADMTRERNLLQRLFDRLNEEYAKRQWQIEMVDLRWGISQEAGLDNKTMQICKTEIARCQQLSPHPNFIILLGNRYGWTPLPETIQPKDANWLVMNAEEKELFSHWYSYDANALPDGEYVLQRRTPPYDDCVRWFNEVEYPLSRVFIRNNHTGLRAIFDKIVNQKNNPHTQLFGLSATEQEIQMGALQVIDANKHVIAYMRNLNKLPTDKESIFIENGKQAKEALKTLKQRVKEKLDTKNIYTTDLTYTEYLSLAFEQQFEQEMEYRIRKVIEYAIDEYNWNLSGNEDEEHMLIAEEEASHFVGRKEELTAIDQYINDSHEHRPLWIRAHSGFGKTALLAKVAITYRKSHRVICRFCGQTAQTIDIKGLFSSINRTISANSKISGNEIYLNDFKPDVPTLIILDALNQVDDRGNLYFSKMSWLKINLHPMVKVIISTTDELKYTNELPFLRLFNLPDMGVDSELIIIDILNKKKRQLTEQQMQILKQIIAKSDHSAVYLRTLGYYLATQASWTDISNLPADLTSLIHYYISELSQPERHGSELTIATLSLLAYERQGLTQEEILTMLSMDKQLYKKIENSSFHLIEDKSIKRIPTVLWSRLSYDLQPLLRQYNTKGGRLTTIFHSEARNSIKSLFRDNHIKDTDNETYYRRILFDYYSEKATKNNRHALLELFHSIDYVRSMLINPALEYLHIHHHILLNKYLLFPDELLTDFDILISHLTDDKRQYIALLKQQMSTLPKATIKEQLMLYIASLPKSSPLYQLYADETNIRSSMMNLLADHEPPPAVVHALSEVGESPCMSEDGTKVASLLQNGHELLITYILNPSNSYSLFYNDRIISLACDDNMRLLLIRSKYWFAIRDLQRKRNIITFGLEEKGWVSLSGNGRKLAFGDNKSSVLFELIPDAEQDTMCYRFLRNYQPAIYGKLTPSARYLWMLSNNRSLVRMDTLKEKNVFCNNIRFLDKRYKAIEGLLPDEDAVIINCLDDCCICYYNHAVKINLSQESFSTSYHRLYPTISGLNLNYNAVLSNDNQYVYYFEGLHCCVFRQEKNKTDEFIVQNYIIPQCINRDLSLALIGNQIVDFKSQMRRYVLSDGNVGGVNSLSSSYNGQRAIISTGKNIGMERRLELLKIIDGKQKEWLPAFSTTNYSFVISSCISPNGNFIAASSTGGYKEKGIGGNELLLYSEMELRPITNISTGESGCIHTCFSNDSNYLIAIRGDYISDPKPALFVMDKSGQLLHKYEELTWKEACKNNLIITENNHYVILPGFNTYWIFDLVSGKHMSIGGHKHVPYKSIALAQSQSKAEIIMLRQPGYPILTYHKGEGSIIACYIEKNSIYKLNIRMRPVAASPSGLKLYLLDENRLYYIEWMVKGNPVRLLDDVLCVIPALDDNHLYVVTTGHIVLLYNVAKQQIEQKAYRGVTFHYQACAKGLYMVNEKGEPALFQPRKDLSVNVPAVTTFVGRWNMKTQEQESPTAICPMCGGIIELEKRMHYLMSKNENITNPINWNASHLRNHHCPHCSAELTYNPYIL